MTTWLLHGFNVSDGGKQSIGKMIPYLDSNVKSVNYGWTFLFGLSCTNSKATKKLLKLVKPGDSIIAHSNGCLLAWNIADLLKGDLASVVCINPALRRDAKWPASLSVLCIYNHTDWVVQLGRWWSRLFPFDGIDVQGWGAAGKYGFTSNQPKVDNWDSAETYWSVPVKGHSGLFEDASISYWSYLIRAWIKLTHTATHQ